MYPFGAYWFWIPPIRSSTRGIGRLTRSNSSCRARSARFSSRVVRTRSATVGDRTGPLFPAVLVLTTCRSALYDPKHDEVALGEALTTWLSG